MRKISNYTNLLISVLPRRVSDDGLIGTGRHGADKMSLFDFVVASKDLPKKAQAGKLAMAEMSGSTFSITNLGMLSNQVIQSNHQP